MPASPHESYAGASHAPSPRMVVGMTNRSTQPRNPVMFVMYTTIKPDMCCMLGVGLLTDQGRPSKLSVWERAEPQHGRKLNCVVLFSFVRKPDSSLMRCLAVARVCAPHICSKPCPTRYGYHHETKALSSTPRSCNAREGDYAIRVCCACVNRECVLRPPSPMLQEQRASCKSSSQPNNRID